MIKLWNTASRSLETLKPIREGEIGMYACGPTVYNPAHIGNFRAFLFEDVLHRTLELLGYKVHHVMNVTDVGHLVGDGDTGEDKVEREASRTGQNAWEIAKKYEALLDFDLERLNVISPKGKDRPHATDYIPQQEALVKKLEEKGYTYETSDGIYFDTSKFAGYGKLSGQKREDKEAGARVEINEEKKHPADFALWKFSPEGEKRQMEWEFEGRQGFPGWHIECSAMSEALLGQPFDIHCGGVDHIPVHHENEIAQSEAAFDKPLANYWMHVEFLLVDGGRMGKSEGNAYLLDELVARGFDPLAFRYYCLGTHYRSKLNFTWEGLEGAQNALRKLQRIFRFFDWNGISRVELDARATGILQAFEYALSNDLNTSEALSVVWEFANDETIPIGVRTELFLRMDSVLGLGFAALKGFELPLDVKLLAEQREIARENKDWKRSDELRDAIKTKGWIVEDGKDGYELHSAIG